MFIEEFAPDRQATVAERALNLPDPAQIEQVRQGLRVASPFFWQWFRAHQNDPIVMGVKVRQLRGLFEQIFGKEGAA